MLRKRRRSDKKYHANEGIYQAFHDDNDHSPPPPRYDADYHMRTGASAIREQQQQQERRPEAPIAAAATATSLEDDTIRSYRPDAALNLKPDTREEDEDAHNVPHLKLQPLRPDGD